ncbi:MAG TPA: methyltransferase domain-containing protein [Verrucomicrobiae bacterium]|nr:methyltransferase domain-containing protein [Verrucomicrobiae bacterium]
MSEIELHRQLLGDTVRNDAFAAALKRVVKPGAVVADIGAGTGFLSFLARRLGAKACHLYEYTPAIELAQALARRNGIDGLTFVQAHSTQVRQPPKADVVVSETLGNFALEEGLLETLADARRFLKPGGKLLPRALREFVAPVTSPRLQREVDVWAAIGHGLDFAEAREFGLNNMYVKLVRPDDLPGEKIAATWDEIEFDGKDKPTAPRHGEARWNATQLNGAAVHGFALWWEIELAPGITLSTSPYALATHWQQVYLPLLEPLHPAAGESIEIALKSDTRKGVRLVWEACARKAGGKPRGAQRLDLLRGRL